jgi:hypothetical protein
MAKVYELVKEGVRSTLEYVDNGTVIITAYWKEGIGGFGWSLFDKRDEPLYASKDVLIDDNWRVKR